jgi:hypothetical protein
MDHAEFGKQQTTNVAAVTDLQHESAATLQTFNTLATRRSPSHQRARGPKCEWPRPCKQERIRSSLSSSLIRRRLRGFGETRGRHG